MSSSEDFDRQLEALSRDIVYSDTHWHLAMKLRQAIYEYQTVYAESQHSGS